MNLSALASELLAALGGAPTQHARLLRLHTPLGPDVLLAERAEIHETVGPGHDLMAASRPSHQRPDAALSAPANGLAQASAFAGSRMVVEALCTDTHLALKSLIGQPALLELLTAQSRTDLRPFHGHITAAELLGSDGGLARYRLTIEPWLAFAAHRRDSFIFQDQTVVEILESVFADYAGQGTLAPAWRWDLADSSVYPRRSLCTQYQESDLDFVQRLLLEEGLFCWWEHTGDTTADSLGSHTLVIADHNGAFSANAQPLVRFTQSITQSSGALPQDSLHRWRQRRQVHTASLSTASEDYRSLSLRPVSQTGAAGHTLLPELSLQDVPGPYAWEDSAQGERLALRQMQALDALRLQSQAQSSLRLAAAGSVWSLRDHPVHDGNDEARDTFVTLAVRHEVRNNLRADLKAQLDQWLPHPGRRDTAGRASTEFGGAEAAQTPIYRNSLLAQPMATPVRPVAWEASAEPGLPGLPDVRLQRRPTITGVQTAIVVGDGEPLLTDRDHRIKIQFHWQRGAQSSHGLAHPSGDENAPASGGSGTWVRVAQSVAGANWGANFIPRVGQEVLVSFIAGDIDRPVVVGALYNGQGTANAQGNSVAAGRAASTGNAPAWFPGDAAQGDWQAHQHPQVFSGFKSQELDASQSGQGGYNQLVLDDTPGANRLELASTSAATRLQLGHLLQQTDNQRLQSRGHGLDLSTAAWGAVRAGSGLLLSAHAKPASTASAQQMDAREAQSRLSQGRELLHTLAESAQAHQAQLVDEPTVKGAKPDQKDHQLPVERGLYASEASLGAVVQSGTQSGGGSDTARDGSEIGGGHGSTSAWSRPDLVLAAPGGIGSFTPASQVASSGGSTSLVAGQDVQHLAQGHLSRIAKDGLVLFTYGKATNPTKPNTETGIRLHAATGSVNTQSQTGPTHLTADSHIDVASTSAQVSVASPKQILLTAAGAAIRIEAGKITLSGPGKVEFRAGMKELTGGGRASSSMTRLPISPDVADVYSQQLQARQFIGLNDITGLAIARVPYKVKDKQGRTVSRGVTDSNGDTARIFTRKAEELNVFLGDGEWRFFADAAHAQPTQSSDSTDEASHSTQSP